MFVFHLLRLCVVVKNSQNKHQKICGWSRLLPCNMVYLSLTTLINSPSKEFSHPVEPIFSLHRLLFTFNKGLPRHSTRTRALHSRAAISERLHSRWLRIWTPPP